ncbi:MAG: T9SS type A sorting domain-containing protein [Bacteroidales bacterium]|nr:T9SS type A sorting domain-containing protein [Bacteroidales bacterium]
MKRLIILLVEVVLAVTVTQAQIHIPVSDTVEGRCDNYYYNPKDETCPWFLDNSPAVYNKSHFHGQRFTKLALVEHTDRRMAVKGIAAMVQRLADFREDWGGPIYFYSPNPGKKAEYTYLCTGDTNELVILDSARWDTVIPRLWKFQKHPEALNDNTTDSFYYCHLYETYFDEPVLVDSNFTMAGSFNCNSDATIWTYLPTSYFLVAETYNVCLEGCHKDSSGYLYSCWNANYLNSYREELYNYYDSLGELDRYKDSIDHAISLIWRRRLDRAKTGHLGPFFAIVDFYQLHVTVADSCAGMGWALGSGRYPNRSLDTIEARPRPGFCFVQWDDGSTDNPRIVDLTQDTLFTALFGTCPTHDIQSPTESTLSFSVQPNPTTGTVTVGTPSDGSYQLTLHDMAGRQLMQTSFTGTAATLDLSHLAAGSYQLMLRSATASGIKVIVKQ